MDIQVASICKNEEDTKVCNKCRLSKPLSNFCINRTQKDGLNYICRSCKKERDRLFRLRHREKMDKKTHSKRIQILDGWCQYLTSVHGKFQCECCGRDLKFTSYRKGYDPNNTVNWDHRFGDESIKVPPSEWLIRHPCNHTNKKIWNECDFGVLCRRCNTNLGSPQERLIRVKNFSRYIRSSNTRRRK